MPLSAWLILSAFVGLCLLFWRGWKARSEQTPIPFTGEQDEPESRTVEESPSSTEDVIDLHGFLPKDVPDVVASYLDEAHDMGLCEVRLIHGRGKGVQRRRVQSLLSRHPLVVGYGDAPAHRGGWGATIVELRSRSTDDPNPPQK